MDNIDNDEEGLVFHLGSDDSALVVRSDGSVELISKEFEKKGDGEYLGDIEDLNRTFSLVLALAASLENEQLYHQIFQNLNVILMKQWDRLPADKKKEIADIRKIRHDQETIEDKKKRLDSFRDRMNDYKDNFLDADRRRMQEELERAREHFENRPYDEMETKRRKKKKVNPLNKMKDIKWDPNDESLTAHFKDYRADDPPSED